jgi:hypothetical protein
MHMLLALSLPGPALELALGRECVPAAGAPGSPDGLLLLLGVGLAGAVLLGWALAGPRQEPDTLLRQE